MEGFNITSLKRHFDKENFEKQQKRKAEAREAALAKPAKRGGADESVEGLQALKEDPEETQKKKPEE